MSRVLILEPAKSVRKSLCELIEIDGFEAMGVEDLAHCEAAFEAAMAHNIPFDILIYNVDLRPKYGALSEIPSIAISDNPSIDEALQMTRLGARDYISRPYDLNRILRVVRETILEKEECGSYSSNIEATHAAAATKMTTPPPKVTSTSEQHPKWTNKTRRRTTKRAPEEHLMIGNSSGINNLRSIIKKIAPYDARVMILGENGTGKELVARSIHEMSHRNSAPFVEVNCAAIPAELIESELFGHEKGAFTSAVKLRHGKFEQANGGTLFLDEIGDMSLAAQAKVLRALQEHKITRVGSDCDIDVDVRVLAATNKNIRAEIAAGNFREDLFHRLSVIVINVAALRDRTEDIPLLVDYFLQQICDSYNFKKKVISTKVMESLMQRSWSGNIRELRNIIERLVVLSGENIEINDLELYCKTE